MAKGDWLLIDLWTGRGCTQHEMRDNIEAIHTAGGF